jgi:hypothetical protein
MGSVSFVGGLAVLGLNSGPWLARQVLYRGSHTPALFALVTFQIGSCIYALAGLDCDPPISASLITGVIGICHSAQVLLVEMGS